MSSAHHRNPIIGLGAAAAFILSFVLFYFVSQSLFIGRDEGFYLLAGILASEGRIPYIDFFYPQTPLMPYVYGCWSALVGAGWSEARLLSALLSAGVGVCVFGYVNGRAGRGWAFVGLLLFALNAVVLRSFPAVKNYALSTLFAFASVWLLDRALREKRAGLVLGAGVLLAIGINARLTMAACIPAAIILCLAAAPGYRKGFILKFAAGLAIGLSVNLIFMSDPGAYWFNNLGYHLTRTSEEGESLLSQKFQIAKVLSGFAGAAKYEVVQMPLLLWSAVGCAGWMGIRFRRIDSMLLTGFFVAAASILPDPAYIQYFSAAVPFLAAGVARTLGEMNVGAIAARGRWAFGSVLAGAMILYFNAALQDIPRFTVTGEGVIGIDSPEQAESWRVSTITMVSEELSRIAPQGGEVIAWWPGYVIGTPLRMREGLENHFALTFLRKYPNRAGELRRMHLREQRQFLREIRERIPAAVVRYGLNRRRHGEDPLEAALSDGGYRLQSQIAEHEIYCK